VEIKKKRKRKKGRCKKEQKKVGEMKKSVRKKKEIIQALVFNSLPSSSFNVIAIR